MSIPNEPWVKRELLWHNYYLRSAMTYDDYFCEHILSESYEPHKYRKFVEENYPLKRQLANINNIFVQLEAKIESKHNQNVPDNESQNYIREKVRLAED